MACLIAVGAQLALIFALLWIDRVFLGYTRVAYAFGIELVTSCMILTGILYGPSFAFLFGFLVYPIVDAFRWMVAVPFDPEWPPLIPSPESFIAGATGFLAGLLSGFLPFLVVVFACLIIRIPVCVLKDWIFYEMPLRPAYFIAIPFSFIVVNALHFLVV